MPAATAAETPAGESSTTMQSAGTMPALAAACRNRSGAGLPAATPLAENTFGSKKRSRSVHSRLARTRSIGDEEATAFRPAQPGQGMHDMRHGAQFVAQPHQRLARDLRGEARRQLDPGRRFDIGEHVGRAPAGEIARDDFGRDPQADALQFLRRDRHRDRLGVDQHAIAIEDDHTRSPGAGCSGTGTPLVIRSTTIRTIPAAIKHAPAARRNCAQLPARRRSAIHKNSVAADQENRRGAAQSSAQISSAFSERPRCPG